MSVRKWMPTAMLSVLGCAADREPERAFGDATGSLYEGVGTDFVEDWLTRFEPKTDATDDTFAPLLAVAEALTVPDGALVEALEQVVNLDLFVTFWALEVLVNHTDAYGSARNNYYVYFDPGDGHRAVLLPWGVDKLPTYADLPLENHLMAELARRLSRDDEMVQRMESELSRPATIAALLTDGVPAGADETAACLPDEGGGDQECPEDFDATETCEDGDKCQLDDVWWYCDGGVWVAY